MIKVSEQESGTRSVPPGQSGDEVYMSNMLLRDTDVMSMALWRYGFLFWITGWSVCVVASDGSEMPGGKPKVFFPQWAGTACQRGKSGGVSRFHGPSGCGVCFGIS